MEDIDIFTFIGRMGQHILPKGMQRIRYYGLQATAVYQKIRKKLRAILPADAGQCRETSTIARKNYQQRVIETSSKSQGQSVRTNAAAKSARVAPEGSAI